MKLRRRARAIAIVVPLLLATAQGCGTTNAPAVQPCDQLCMDKTAALGLRFGLRDAFNSLLQGHDVGAQDSMVQPCMPFTGTVHIFGTATANAAQGATIVDLTYVVDHCVVQRIDNDPTQSYKLTFTGTIHEKGTIAVQPSATTSLALTSDSLTISGTVEDPAIDYEAMSCPITFAQSGNQMSGSMCGRDVGLTL